MDAEMASWKSTSTYVDAVPPSGVNMVDGMWIFRVKRPPGSPRVFKARYVARGFSQRQGVDFFQTFSPTPKMTTLRVLLHVAAQRDYELHSLDFSIALLQGSLHEEIWLRSPPGFTGSFPAGTQWSLRRPLYSLCQAPREWHDTLRTTLVALGFAPLTADPSLFLCTDTLLPPFYVLVYANDLVFATADTEALALVKSKLQKRHTCTNLGELRSYLGLQITRDRARRTITLTQSHMVHQVLQCFSFRYSSPQPTLLPTGHSLSAPPSDESVEPSGPYPELVGCLIYLMTCTRPDLAYPLRIMARYVAPERHRPEHWEAAKRVLRYLYNTSSMGLMLGGRGPVVFTGHADAFWVDDLATQWSSSCEAEIYAVAMAAQELRWLTYLLTDLGERPHSSPVLYVDNKAMIALCHEHRLEHRTKHIALQYFLARELQQRGQLRLAYVAARANTAYIFTKAIQSGEEEGDVPRGGESSQGRDALFQGGGSSHIAPPSTVLREAGERDDEYGSGVGARERGDGFGMERSMRRQIGEGSGRVDQVGVEGVGFESCTIGAPPLQRLATNSHPLGAPVMGRSHLLEKTSYLLVRHVVVEQRMYGQDSGTQRSVQLPRPSTIPTLFDPSPREYTEEDKDRLSRKMVGAAVDKAFTTTPFDGTKFHEWALRFRINARMTNLWEFFVMLQYPVTMADGNMRDAMERLENLQADYSQRATLAFWVLLHS
ncbi:unnamed protein product, partial [Closterium sp. NIES-53]